MNRLILIAFASACFLLSTSGVLFSATSVKSKSGVGRHTIVKKPRVPADKPKGVKVLRVQNPGHGQKTGLHEGRKEDRNAKNASPQATISTEVEGEGEFIEYRVKKGDTLEKVAMKFGIDKKDVLGSNRHLRRGLSPGRVLLIPGTGESETVEDLPDLSTGALKPWKTHEERYMLVKVAKSFMGAPYRYGGESVRGLDCSAFVKKIYDIFDVQLPRAARDQYKTGPKISREELSIGDLVFFKTKRYANYPTHVGIYIGEGNFIHSSSGHARIGVKIDCLQTDFYNRTYIGATRVKELPDEGPSDAPSNEAEHGSMSSATPPSPSLSVQ